MRVTLLQEFGAIQAESVGVPVSRDTFMLMYRNTNKVDG